MSADLTAFLRARLSEDEATAKAAGGDSWRASESGVYHEDAANLPGPFAVGPYEYLDDDERSHIARHDPARACREVEAKRAILDEHAPGYPVTYPEPSGQPTCGICHAGTWEWEPSSWPCLTTRLLAAVYSDHPDYREEWKP